MSEYAKTHALDVDNFEVARSIHRVVRAMNDGECPKCHIIVSSDRMRRYTQSMFSPDSGDLVCPECSFRITKVEQDAAIATFAPVMGRNLDIFEEWRKSL